MKAKFTVTAKTPRQGGGFDISLSPVADARDPQHAGASGSITLHVDNAPAAGAAAATAKYPPGQDPAGPGRAAQPDALTHAGFEVGAVLVAEFSQAQK